MRRPGMIVAHGDAPSGGWLPCPARLATLALALAARRVSVLAARTAVSGHDPATRSARALPVSFTEPPPATVAVRPPLARSARVRPGWERSEQRRLPRADPSRAAHTEAAGGGCTIRPALPGRSSSVEVTIRSPSVIGKETL